MRQRVTRSWPSAQQLWQSSLALKLSCLRCAGLPQCGVALQLLLILYLGHGRSFARRAQQARQERQVHLMGTLKGYGWRTPSPSADPSEYFRRLEVQQFSVMTSVMAHPCCRRPERHHNCRLLGQCLARWLTAPQQAAPCINQHTKTHLTNNIRPICQLGLRVVFACWVLFTS